jgi:hypothetical protein
LKGSGSAQCTDRQTDRQTHTHMLTHTYTHTTTLANRRRPTSVFTGGTATAWSAGGSTRCVVVPFPFWWMDGKERVVSGSWKPALPSPLCANSPHPAHPTMLFALQWQDGFVPGPLIRCRFGSTCDKGRIGACIFNHGACWWWGKRTGRVWPVGYLNDAIIVPLSVWVDPLYVSRRRSHTHIHIYIYIHTHRRRDWHEHDQARPAGLACLVVVGCVGGGRMSDQVGTHKMAGYISVKDDMVYSRGGKSDNHSRAALVCVGGLSTRGEGVVVVDRGGVSDD